METEKIKRRKQAIRRILVRWFKEREATAGNETTKEEDAAKNAATSKTDGKRAAVHTHDRNTATGGHKGVTSSPKTAHQAQTVHEQPQSAGQCPTDDGTGLRQTFIRIFKPERIKKFRHDDLNNYRGGRIHWMMLTLRLKALHIIQLLIISIKRDQLFVCTSLDDLAFKHYTDLISVLDSAQPVGNGNSRTRLHQTLQSFLYQAF